MQDNGGNSGPSSPRKMMKYNSYWGKASRELCVGSGLATRPEAKQPPEADYYIVRYILVCHFVHPGHYWTPLVRARNNAGYG